MKNLAGLISISDFDLNIIQELLGRIITSFCKAKQKKITRDEHLQLTSKVVEAIKFLIFSILVENNFEIVDTKGLGRQIENNFYVLLEELLTGKRKAHQKKFLTFLRNRIAWHIVLNALRRGYITYKFYPNEITESQNGKKLHNHYEFYSGFFSFFEVKQSNNNRRKKSDSTKIIVAKHFARYGFKQANLFDSDGNGKFNTRMEVNDAFKSLKRE